MRRYALGLDVSLVARHDGKFQIVQRHGFIAIADTLCGPYKMQKPTWTYPQANLPNVDRMSFNFLGTALSNTTMFRGPAGSG